MSPATPAPIHVAPAIVLAAAALCGCGPPAVSEAMHQQVVSEKKALEAEVSRLRTQIEELQFGAERLLASARASLAKKHYSAATSDLDELLKRHPQSPEATAAAALRVEAQRQQAAHEAAQAAAEQRLRDRVAAEQQREAAARQRALELATRNMRRSQDEVRGITWMKHREASDHGSFMQLYFGTDKADNGRPMPLRLKIQFSGSSWLFVQNVTIKADDGVHELATKQFERDHNGGTIWEWSDTVFDAPQQLGLLQHWLDAKRVVIRFDGSKYYHDFVLPPAQQQRMREVLKVWEHLKAEHK